MRRALAAGGLLTCLLAATPARAAEGDADGRAPALVSWKRTLCLYTGCFLEPLVPDVRYEWGPGPREHWLLSWPIHPWALPPLDVPGPTLILSPFVEPQLRLKPSVFRLLAGARVSAFPDTLRFGVLAEGAGLWGEDGSGGMAGVGLTYDLIERHRHTVPWTLSVILRRSWTGEGNRTDVSFDVTVPLNMFFGSPLDSGESTSRSSSNRSTNPRLRPGHTSSVFARSTLHIM
ncbi:hypothetical protein [Pyxidicoccus trucidator]|uniref:hypothetical protein n=1 Tax=Pyxidicoccus trucidator TaxID=2709662 RepID=UPI001F079A85|nr:hypothetical protein [Pyxidicoccus trucidator]